MLKTIRIALTLPEELVRAHDFICTKKLFVTAQMQIAQAMAERVEQWQAQNGGTIPKDYEIESWGKVRAPRKKGKQDNGADKKVYKKNSEEYRRLNELSDALEGATNGELDDALMSDKPRVKTNVSLSSRRPASTKGKKSA